MAEIEAVVEPDGVGDDIGRESVAFVDVHTPILPISASLVVPVLGIKGALSVVELKTLKFRLHSDISVATQMPRADFRCEQE
jgi:hypothetical protein